MSDEKVGQNENNQNSKKSGMSGIMYFLPGLIIIILIAVWYIKKPKDNLDKDDKVKDEKVSSVESNIAKEPVKAVKEPETIILEKVAKIENDGELIETQDIAKELDTDESNLYVQLLRWKVISQDMSENSKFTPKYADKGLGEPYKKIDMTDNQEKQYLKFTKRGKALILAMWDWKEKGTAPTE